MGQLKSGDTIRYRRVSLEDALKIRAEMEKFLMDVSAFANGECKADAIVPLTNSAPPQSTVSGKWGKALISSTQLIGSEDFITFRQVWSTPYNLGSISNYHSQGGDDFLLVEFGDGKFNLNHRCRVSSLDQAFKKYRTSDGPLDENIYKTTGCCNCESRLSNLLTFADNSFKQRS